MEQDKRGRGRPKIDTQLPRLTLLADGKLSMLCTCMKASS